MKKDETQILYDSPEAAQLKTVTGWVSSDGRFFGKDENLARFAGSTHKKCDCGNLMSISYTKCENCRRKSDLERYNKLPFEPFTGQYVCERDGDKYFFDEDEIIDYMEENNVEEIDLLVCIPVEYSPLQYEDIAGDAHEDWEPEKELIELVKSFNEALSKFPPHSWMPGKIRTKYKRERKCSFPDCGCPEARLCMAHKPNFGADAFL